MKWIAIAAVLSLFIFFPKKMFGGLGLLVLVGSIIGGFFLLPGLVREKSG